MAQQQGRRAHGCHRREQKQTPGCRPGRRVVPGARVSLDVPAPRR
jgi:hypothetical protein